MASQLEIELGKLRSAIVKINNLAEGQVFEAMGVLLFEPISERKDVKKAESKIDKLDLKIEDICQSVFALQQPVASDLRFIMSAMHMGNEAERIGDLSISIIKLAKNINKKHDLIEKFNITAIAREVESISIKTNVCFQTMGENIIPEILTLNNDIKEKTAVAIESTIGEMKSSSKTVVSGTNLIMALKHMERISDHCSNIAESVYFMINAKTIKHEKYNEKK
jgi:phosphate transport system protein